MIVINDGKQVNLTASFSDMTLIVVAIRKAIPEYEHDGEIEVAEELGELLKELLNPQNKS